MVPSHVLMGCQAVAVIVMLITTCQANVSTTLSPSPSPTPSPIPIPPVNLDRNTTANSTSQCSTGPVIEEAASLLLTGFTYIDIENPVPCGGVLVHWDFCYYVVGFRDISAEMWPEVWRRGNDSSYHLVGKNMVSIIPEEDEDNSTARCRYEVVPDEFIKVEKGDYIGFYLPDSGILVAKSSSEPDPTSYQYRQSSRGYTTKLYEEQLITVGNIGRALVKAAIDADANLTIITGFGIPVPSITPTPTPTPSPTQANDETPAVPGLPTALITGIAAASGGTILILLLVILCLVAMVIRRRAKSAELDDSMEYNDMYDPSNQTHIVIGGQRNVVNIGGNPAYTDNLLRFPTSEREQIEHTYESLSNLSVHTVRHIGITQH